MRDTVAFAFGRLNPPTRAHGLLVHTIAQQEGEPRLYLSHSQDPKKNPLSYDKKIEYCKLAFEDEVNVKDSNARNAYEIMTELYNEGFKNIIYVCGSDRVEEAERLKAYNGIPDKQGNLLYKFDSIQIVKAGNNRINEDDVPIELVSASMQRQFAADNNLESFKQGCPENLSEEECENLFYDVREGMGLSNAGFELTPELIDEELLNEGQANIIGNIIVTYSETEDGPDITKIYDVYTSGSSYNLIMHNERHYSDWANRTIKSIKAYVETPNRVINTSETENLQNCIKSSYDGHIQFKIGGLTFTGKEGGGNNNEELRGAATTVFQEIILGLILKGNITVDSIDNLVSYKIQNNKLYFIGNTEGIIPPVNINDPSFEIKWVNFIDRWKGAFKRVAESKNNFYAEAGILGWSLDKFRASTMLHPYYGDGLFIHKNDIFDKSDVYFCTDIGIVNKLNSLTSDVKEYCKFMKEHSDEIIGVSLKRPSGKEVNYEFDKQGYTEDSFTKDSSIVLHLSSPKEGNNIVTTTIEFKGVELIKGAPHPILAIRSAGMGKTSLEWKFSGALAQAGKGSQVLADIAPSLYTEISNLSKQRNFVYIALAILNWLGVNITNNKALIDEQIRLVKNGEEMTAKTIIFDTPDNNEFKRKFCKYINLSIGYSGTNDKGERITAPYIKVY